MFADKINDTLASMVKSLKLIKSLHFSSILNLIETIELPL